MIINGLQTGVPNMGFKELLVSYQEYFYVRQLSRNFVNGSVTGFRLQGTLFY